MAPSLPMPYLECLRCSAFSAATPFSRTAWERLSCLHGCVTVTSTHSSYSAAPCPQRWTSKRASIQSSDPGAPCTSAGQTTSASASTPLWRANRLMHPHSALCTRYLPRPLPHSTARSPKPSHNLPQASLGSSSFLQLRCWQGCGLWTGMPKRHRTAKLNSESFSCSSLALGQRDTHPFNPLPAAYLNLMQCRLWLAAMLAHLAASAGLLRLMDFALVFCSSALAAWLVKIRSYSIFCTAFASKPPRP